MAIDDDYSQPRIHGYLLLVKRKSRQRDSLLSVYLLTMAMEDESHWNGDTRTEEQSASVSITGGEKSPRHVHLPLYTERQPPLVQPLETSAFAERTFEEFGMRDLGHDWVTLFQTIGEGNCGGYSKSMKLNVPDTILLSPSGYVVCLCWLSTGENLQSRFLTNNLCGRLPSMWYSTSASSYIKPQNLMV